MKKFVSLVVCFTFLFAACSQAQEPAVADPQAHSKAVSCAHFSQDGKKIVTVGRDGTTRIWDVETETGKILFTFTENNGNLHFADLSPDAKKIVTAGFADAADGRRGAGEVGCIRVWDAETGKQLHKLEGYPDHYRYYAAFSADGKKVIAPGGVASSTTLIWDTESGKTLQRLKVQKESVRTAAFSPDGKRIVTGSYENIVRIWDVETGEKLQELGEHANYSSSAFFSPDGKKVASSGNWTVQIWDVESDSANFGKELHKFEMKNWDRGVHASAFSPDGKKILAVGGHRSDQMCIWDVESGKELQKIDGANSVGNIITSAVFSPDGKKILTAGDYAVCIWDVESGKKLKQWALVSGFRMN
jgi:WD40 repeat protein